MQLVQSWQSNESLMFLLALGARAIQTVDRSPVARRVTLRFCIPVFCLPPLPLAAVMVHV